MSHSDLILPAPLDPPAVNYFFALDLANQLLLVNHDRFNWTLATLSQAVADLNLNFPTLCLEQPDQQLTTATGQAFYPSLNTAFGTTPHAITRPRRYYLRTGNDLTLVVPEPNPSLASFLTNLSPFDYDPPTLTMSKLTTDYQGLITQTKTMPEWLDLVHRESSALEDLPALNFANWKHYYYQLPRLIYALNVLGWNPIPGAQYYHSDQKEDLS